jgi:hypothetical protein
VCLVAGATALQCEPALRDFSRSQAARETTADESRELPWTDQDVPQMVIATGLALRD